jgi:RNA polymerase sigma-70 factor (ECF subfamily)
MEVARKGSEKERGGKVTDELAGLPCTGECDRMDATGGPVSDDEQADAKKIGTFSRFLHLEGMTLSQQPSRADSLPARYQTPAVDDIHLVDRIRAGDPIAFELIMRRYNQRLYRLAWSIVKNGAEAEDVVQESYVRAYEKLADFIGPTGFAAWLGRIVINEALGRRRKQGRVISLEDYVESTGSGLDRHWIDMMKSQEPSPERLAANSELGRLLENAIAALPEKFRMVFILRAIEGMNIEETALTLDIRPETVKTRFHRSRQLLQGMLDTQFDALMPTMFPLGGRHCDNVVATVLNRLGYAFDIK